MCITCAYYVENHIFVNNKINTLVKKIVPMVSVLCLAVYLFTCQKELTNAVVITPPPPPPVVGYFAAFKANGVEQKYYGTTQALFSKDSVYHCNIAIAVAPSSYAQRLQINLADMQNITTNICYCGKLLHGTPQASLIYSDNASKKFMSAITKNPGIEVTLTESTADHVSGIFSCRLQSPDDIAKGDTSHYMVITDGSFFVKK